MDDACGFAGRLDSALKARNIGKMYALAVALGIDESALSRWRRGKPISVGNLIRLTRHLRISIDWLLTGSGSMDAGRDEAAELWQSELIADVASLDAPTRQRLTDLTRHLAQVRRSGCFDPASWTAQDYDDGVRPLNRRGAGS